MSRRAWIAAYIAAGPITGPLIAGLRRALREHRPVLATLYALAIPCALYLLSLTAAHVVRH